MATTGVALISIQVMRDCAYSQASKVPLEMDVSGLPIHRNIKAKFFPAGRGPGR